MNKIVYLYELDSVRKKRQTAKNGVYETDGVKGLFNEIIKNGNSIAITMNQLVDSEFFSQVIRDDYAYSCMLKLFEKGALRISLYGRIKTLSQYVQESIDKCLNQNEETFLFSNLPIDNKDKELLNTVKQSLVMSDLSVFQQRKDNAKNNIEYKKADYLYRFIHMVLKISCNLQWNLPAKPKSERNFMWYYEKIINALENCDFEDECLRKEVERAIKELEYKKGKIKGDKNYRSNWLDNGKDERSLSPMAQTVINLCYNYTVENSISGVSKHYDDSDLDRTLAVDVKNRITTEYKKTASAKVEKTVSKRKWKIAMRLSEYRPKGSSLRGEVYEKNFSIERRRWYGFVLGKTAISFLWAVFYIVLFFCIESLLNFAENAFSLKFGNGFTFTMLNIFIFGIVGSLIGLGMKKLNKGRDVPDILESMVDIFIRIGDYVYVKTEKEDDSYRVY